MPNLARPAIAESLNGGRVTGVPAHLVGLEESPDAENFDPSSYLGVTTRNGYTKHSVDGPAASAVNGVKHWQRNNATTFVIACTGTTIYRVGSGAWNSIKTGVTQDGAMRAKALADTLVIVAEGLAPQKTTDATTVSALGGTPPSLAKYVALWKSKIWLAGDTANPQRLTLSASGDPEDYTTANNAGSITMDTGGGDVIKGLMPTQDTLVVLFRHQVQVIFGSSVFDYFVRPVASKGIPSEFGYASSERIGFFASDDGIYSISGGTIALISQKIDQDYTDISDKSKVSLAVKNDYLIVTDHGAASPYSLVLDIKRGVWSKWTNQKFKSYDLSVDNDLYGGTSASTAQLFKVDNGTTDDGTAVAVKWTTPDLDFGRWDLKKNLVRYAVHAKPGLPTTTTKFFYDGASIASAHTLVFTTTGRHEFSQKPVPQSSGAGPGAHLALQFTWSGVGTLYGWAAYARLLDNEEVPWRED